MALDSFSSAVQNFARFGQQRLANQEQQQQIELNQMKLDSNRADKAINELSGTGLVTYNADTNSYDVAPDWYNKLQQVPSSERQSLLAGVQSYLGAYEDNGKIEIGEISNVAPVKGKLPTSLKNASEEEKQAWLSDPKNVAYSVPIKRKDGRFSFLTRNRSSDPEDDEAIILSGAEVASWIGARANKLNRLKNPEQFRRAQILNQNQDSLAVTGTGQAGVTFDNLADELTNDLDRIETNPEIAGTGAQTDSLGALLGSWQNSINETLKTQYNQQEIPDEEPKNIFRRRSAELKSPMTEEKQKALTKRRETLKSQIVENPKNIKERTANRVKELQIQRLDEMLQNEIPSEPIETDFPDAPDLSNIKTEEQALELLDSGVLNSFLTEEVIEQSRTILQQEGVTDSQSFNQAIQDNKIKNPYVHSLVIASAIAGPNATGPEVRAQALELFNNIKTGDPQAGPSTLVSSLQANRRLEQDYRDWLTTRSTSQLTRLKGLVDKNITHWNDLATEYAKKDGDVQGKSQIALSNLEGVLAQFGDVDSLVALKQFAPELYEPAINGMSGIVYQKLVDTERGGLFRLLDKDFWGDIIAADDPGGFRQYFERFAWRVDANGKPVELVVTNVGGGKTYESESGIDASRLEDLVSTRVYEMLIRVIPPLTGQ